MKKIKEKDIKAFIKACNMLNEVMKNIREYNEDAEYYLSMDELCLMSEVDCSGNWKANRDNVVESVTIPFSSGGEW